MDMTSRYQMCENYNKGRRWHYKWACWWRLVCIMWGSLGKKSFVACRKSHSINSQRYRQAFIFTGAFQITFMQWMCLPSTYYFAFISSTEQRYRSDWYCILNGWTHSAAPFAIQQPCLISELKGVQWIILNERKLGFSCEEKPKASL